jgi:hypothetical protein
MAALTTTKLQDYLKTLCELHKRKYVLEKSYQALDSKIKSLGHEQRIDNANDSYMKSSLFHMLGAFVGAVILFFIPGLMHGWNGWWVLLAIIILIICWGGAIVLAILGIGSLIGFISNSVDYKRDNKSVKSKREADNARVRYELALLPKLKTQREIALKAYQRVSQELKLLYSLNVIYGKYQNNFAAIATFYEYIESGRASSLTGRDGCYNIFENEIRLDCICSKLDEVVVAIERMSDNLQTVLGKISNQQHELYTAIRDGNREILNLTSATRDLSRAAQASESVASYERQCINASIRAHTTYTVCRDLLTG